MSIEKLEPKVQECASNLHQKRRLHQELLRQVFGAIWSDHCWLMFGIGAGGRCDARSAAEVSAGVGPGKDSVGSSHWSSLLTMAHERLVC